MVPTGVPQIDAYGAVSCFQISMNLRPDSSSRGVAKYLNNPERVLQDKKKVEKHWFRWFHLKIIIKGFEDN